ncbi:MULTISPECIES: hypothetical protein [unclassified Empedobacter]|uniref:hypothetical protein n=1 Tax=unclassified Empedobacter TaxID=2643773 RepID=UPI0025C019C0|nr:MULTISPECIES: hypothetical protein [unclassified Empedobacter]
MEGGPLLQENGVQITIFLIFAIVFSGLLIIIFRFLGIHSTLIKRKQTRELEKKLESLSEEERLVYNQKENSLKLNLTSHSLSENYIVSDEEGIVRNININIVEELRFFPVKRRTSSFQIKSILNGTVLLMINAYDK